MKVLVAGADGYIGFPLSLRLINEGFEVIGIDNLLRRRNVSKIGSYSAIPIRSIKTRTQAIKRAFGKEITFIQGDVTNYDFVRHTLQVYKPDAIVHLAEQPSAPFSMMNIDCARMTQTNNLIGTLNILWALKEVAPRSHLVKLGSMGEYGAPNIEIPEGFIEIEYKGRKDVLPFPRQAFTDWYHVSKVHDSNNILLACNIWGLRSTDIMQGVVYGTRTDELINDDLSTRFDFDEIFGTVINRFCAQAAIGHPLTVYGLGGQKRPFIALRDSLDCFVLTIENPPASEEYRVFNQFDEVYEVAEVAEKVRKVGIKLGLQVIVKHIRNPRIEIEDKERYYNPIHKRLYDLGFEATHTMEKELELILTDLIKNRKRIKAKQERIMPRVPWK